jgi:hypothetical protein
MRIRRIAHSNLFLYFIIFFSINFLGGMPCTPTGKTEYDSSVGKLINSIGGAVSGAKVVQAIANAYPLSYPSSTNINSSTNTLEDGSYRLDKGIANSYELTGGSCSTNNNKGYKGMSSFYLVFSHPSYDTTYVLFTESGNGISYSKADTIFVGAGTNYGKAGSLRYFPTIIIKSKKL